MSFAPVPADRDALGGYFGVGCAVQSQPWPWPGSLLLQSARAGLLALVQTLAPKAFWLPWFICDAMAEPLRQQGIRIHRYALGEDLRIVAPPRLAADEYLLYVNYFGLCDAVVSELEQAYPRERLVLDHAQALYARPAGTATLRSPRKFIGLPDGGILTTDRPVPPPAATDQESLARLRGPLLRMAFGAEAGHAEFQRAERGLAGQPPLNMSLLTHRLLAATDHAQLQAIRRRNFEFVDAALRGHNRLQWQLGEHQVPLCYPFWPRRPIERAELHRARIYVPTYWPELLEPGHPAPAQERAWAAQWLALPIDQRYDTQLLQELLVQPLLDELAGSDGS